MIESALKSSLLVFLGRRSSGQFGRRNEQIHLVHGDHQAAALLQTASHQLQL